MATSSQACSPAAKAAVGGSGTTSTTSHSQTITGSHIFRIDGFSATKDLGDGKSVKSSTFRVAGHGWYIECYPYGVSRGSAGGVYLNLCRQEDHPASMVSGNCEFTLMESLKDGSFKQLILPPRKLVTYADDNRHSLLGTDFMKREELESLLKDDCFQVRCIVSIDMFPDVPPPDLATKTVGRAHSHVMTVDGYSKTRAAHAFDEAMISMFRFAGHSWCLGFYPCGEDEVRYEDKTCLSAYICLDQSAPARCYDEVKVRLEMTLLTLAGQKISSIQDFHTFSLDGMHAYSFEFLRTMDHESSPLLQDGIQIRCDMAVAKGITVVEPPPNQNQWLGDLLASQLGTDVTFEVGGALFSAHKCVLTTRSTAFMAEIFGPAGKANADVVTQVLRINDKEPRVFKALLHFIYTDTLPDVREEDKVVMAQGLLVAADRYAMERLKLICGDVLCCYIDATTAVATQELADKHGCLKLKEACIKVITDWLAA